MRQGETFMVECSDVPEDFPGFFEIGLEVIRGGAPDLVTALVPIPFDTAPLVAAERAAATHRLSMSTREQSR